jgi:rhomboid protease GluP
MFGRRTSGSTVCPGCGSLVGIRDDRCNTCGRWNPGLWGFGPALRALGTDFGFTPLVIGTCALIYIAELAVSGPAGIRSQGILNILSPSIQVLFVFGASGAVPVFMYGRWWTIMSAGWLHGGLLHVFFNMLWMRQLGPAVAELFGGSRMVIIYTLSGAISFLMSSVMNTFLRLPFLGGGGYTVGASGAIFGLLGAVVCYGQRTGSSLIRREAWGYVVPLFVFGLIVPGVDNYAHAGGFAGGYLLARWLDPLKPERVEHFLGAIVCLVLSLVAIAASVIAGLRLLA